MVINTNTQALATANSLNASSVNLSKALARLSSGAKIIVPSDDAAGLAVSSRLEAQVKRLDATVSNVINAISFTQTQDGFLKTVDKAFRRMGELAMLALDTTKSSEDLGLYNQEFVQLKDYVSATVGQTYNSIPLFSTAPIPVTVDSEGVTFAMSAINLDAPAYKTAVNTGTDAWKLTADAWQVTKDGYKTNIAAYKTSKDLWRTNAGAWAATDNGGIKFTAGSIVVDDAIAAADTAAIALATNSFSSKTVSVNGFTADTTANTLTKSGHGLATGNSIKLSGTLPGAVTAGTTYYVNVSGNNITLHTTEAAAIANTGAIDITGANIATPSINIENLSNTLKKGSFVSINPVTSGEDIYAQKITSGSIVAINESEQDISAFATALGADYDNVNLTSAAAAQIAIDLIKKATIQIATDRAKLGAIQSRLNFTHERLTVTKENLSVAISRIADVDVAEETTQYARYQILVQSGTSMLREANAMPQSALKLLQ